MLTGEQVEVFESGASLERISAPREHRNAM
jgi:hypothetical protein